MVLQKQDGSIRPILCGEIYRRSFTNLGVNTTSFHHEEFQLFTSTYDNFIQTVGIRDGSSQRDFSLLKFYLFVFHYSNIETFCFTVPLTLDLPL
jgi:hypothetical protein